MPPGVMDCAGAGELMVKLGGAVPVPLRDTVCGEPLALSAMESVADKAAADAGVNVTEMLQLAPAASELPQLLV